MNPGACRRLCVILDIANIVLDGDIYSHAVDVCSYVICKKERCWNLLLYVAKNKRKRLYLHNELKPCLAGVNVLIMWFYLCLLCFENTVVLKANCQIGKKWNVINKWYCSIELLFCCLHCHYILESNSEAMWKIVACLNWNYFYTVSPERSLFDNLIRKSKNLKETLKFEVKKTAIVAITICKQTNLPRNTVNFECFEELTVYTNKNKRYINIVLTLCVRLIIFD